MVLSAGSEAAHMRLISTPALELPFQRFILSAYTLYQHCSLVRNKAHTVMSKRTHRAGQ